MDRRDLPGRRQDDRERLLHQNPADSCSVQGSVRAMLFEVAVVGSLGSDRDRQVNSVRMPFTLITRGLILIP